MFNEELGSPFIIVHSVSFVKSDKHSVAVLLLRVEKDELDTKGSGFHITLEWVTFVEMNKAGKCFTFMLLVRKGEKKPKTEQQQQQQQKHWKRKTAIMLSFIVLNVDGSSISDVCIPTKLSSDFKFTLSLSSHL